MKERPEIFKNERVSASAGSGKTYALTNRFIALAANAKDPETGLPDPSRITALTFTRKSAGEFLGKILTRLAEAAEDDKAADALSDEVEKLTRGTKSGGGFLTRQDALALLRQCLTNLDKLRLSTIDSFFSSILKCFSNELSIFSEIKIDDEISHKSAAEKIVGEILREKSSDRKTFAEFSEIVKRASFGVEEKSMREILLEKVFAAHGKILETPNLSLWGNAREILGHEPQKWDAAAYDSDRAALRDALAAAKLDGKFAGVEKFFADSNNNILADAKTLEQRLAEMYATGGLNAAFTVKIGRGETEVPAEVAAPLKRLFTRLLDAHVLRSCDAAKAVGTIAKMYEERYDATMRRRGRLAFDDIPLLLESGSDIVGTLAEYRLDAKFDHWLFDEFQDTSETQWNFFKNIIDNVVYESDGQKTFYYVGDVKQSLYSFRGGNRKLFDAVKRRYNADAERVFDGEPLATSWRSGANVIRAVNSFFADPSELAQCFSPAAAAEFSSIYIPHVSAESTGGKKPKPSLAKLVLTEYFGKDSAADFDARCEAVFEIVKTANPAKTGKTCAILVRKNDTVDAFVKALRGKIADAGLDIEVSCEFEQTVARNNAVVPAFLQTLKLAAHPSDTAAAEYLKMTPFADAVNAPDFRKNALEKIAAERFADFAEQYAEAVAEKVGESRDARENLARLVDACREFDASESRGIDNCILFLSGKTFRLSSAETAVQVMTIHKSKGLGFGSVILPDLHTAKKRPPSGLKYIARRSGENTEQFTISYLPQKIVCSLCPSLSESLKIDSENDDFDAICNLYVALTRAEDALYVVMSKHKDAKSKDFGIKNLVLNSFIPALRDPAASDEEKAAAYEKAAAAGGVSIGDDRWFEHVQTPEPASPVKPIDAVQPADAANTFPKLTPSSERGASRAMSADAIRHGKAVHATFEKIKTLDSGIPAAVRRAAELAGTASDLRAAAEVERALANPQIAELFAESERRKIYNEFPFDALLGGKLASGVIDKLIVETDADGNPVSAIVADFKAGAFCGDSRKRQLEIYRAAVAKLFGLDESAIETKIVSYASAAIIDVK